MNDEYLTIPLTQGQCAKVSPEDHEWLSQWKWSARWSKCTNSFYALRNSEYIPGHRRDIILMHRQILGLEKGDKRHGDHVNLDTLDNRRSNLRIATRSQNFHNTGLRSTNTSGFKNVSYVRRLGKYQACIRADGRNLYLGMFKTPEEAFAVASREVQERRGEFGRMDQCQR